jgi:inner membrane protein
MMGRTHLAFGMAAAIGEGMALGWVNPSKDFIYYGSALLGSLLPDIDHPKSMLGRTTLGISHLINKFLGHRGATHYLLTAFLTGGGAFLFTGHIPFSMGLLTGYISHIIGDMMTKSGVPVFGPFSKSAVRFPLTFKTNSPFEVIILAGCLGFIFMYPWWTL